MSDAITLGEGDRPKAAVQVLNKVMSLFIRTGLVTRLDDRIRLLSLKGRRSGRQVQTPVGLHRLDDGREVISAGGAWRHNFHEPHPLVLRQGRASKQGTGQLLTDLDDAATAYHEIATREAEARDIAAVNRLLGLTIHGDTVPGLDDWRWVAEQRGILVVA